MRKSGEMILNLESLCGRRVIADAIKDDFNVGIEKFTEDFNEFFFESGEWGYDDCDKYGIPTIQKYTQPMAKNFLEMVKESLNTNENNLEIEKIKDLPDGMGYELMDVVGGGSDTVTGARNADIKYGLLKGHELIGFISGNNYKNEISVTGFYVREDYQGRGLGQKLIRQMFDKAESESKNTIWFGNASWRGADALARFGKKLEEEGRTDIRYESFDEDLKTKAGLYFGQNESVNY